MNEITVRVCEQGGAFEEVTVNEGSTVRQVLEEANVNINQQKTIRVNMSEGSLTDIVKNGDTIYVVPSMKGNL